jgi:hypothetical protein
MTCQCKTKTVRQPVVTSDTQAMKMTSSTVCTACQTAHATCNIIDGFLARQHELNLNQRRKIQDVTQRLVASSVFRKNATIIVRLTAHLDGVEFRTNRFELARRRANAVVRYLRQTIEAASPNATNRIQFVVSIASKFTPLSIEAQKNRRVEICLPQEMATQMSVDTLSKPRTSLTVIRDSRLVFKNKLRENEWGEMNEFEYSGSSIAAPIRSPVINFPHDGVSLATTNPRLNCNVAGSNALQMKLDNLMNTTYPKLKNKVKIALVNMSGRAATACPSFAALNENENFFGASTPKIAPLYALFQLKYELENVLRTNPSIITIIDLEKAMYLKWASIEGLGTKPKITKLFQLSGKTLSFRPDIQAILNNYSHTNPGVSKIISLVGYAYTGSLMVASGLFEPKPTLKNKRYGEGVLLMSSYGKYISTWGSSPYGGLAGGTQNITAKSVATFFTLLAQNKLAYSRGIKMTLSSGGCVIWGGVPNIVASKCGYYSSYIIDAFLYDDGAGKKFVLSLLTKGLSKNEYLNLRASLISIF